MTKKCLYCGKEVTDTQFWAGVGVKIGRDRCAHTRCIDSHGKESTMNDQTKDILGAADHAHQSIELARSLLQESLGSTGQILMCGCTKLGAASLASTMRLGQRLKEFSFLLGDLLKDAHGLCVLLGHDLGVREGMNWEMADSQEQRLSYGDHFSPMDTPDSGDLGSGGGEFDDDEQPF